MKEYGIDQVNTAETSNAADMVNMIVIDGPVNDSSLIIVPSN